MNGVGNRVVHDIDRVLGSPFDTFQTDVLVDALSIADYPGTDYFVVSTDDSCVRLFKISEPLFQFTLSSIDTTMISIRHRPLTNIFIGGSMIGSIEEVIYSDATQILITGRLLAFGTQQILSLTPLETLPLTIACLGSTAYF